MSNIVACGACKKEISVTANKCPHCGDDTVIRNLGFFGKLVFIFSILGTLAGTLFTLFIIGFIAYLLW